MLFNVASESTAQTAEARVLFEQVVSLKSTTGWARIRQHTSIFSRAVVCEETFVEAASASDKAWIATRATISLSAIWLMLPLDKRAS
jgi:hypothetical protein